MIVKITREEIKEEFLKRYGEMPSDELVEFAFAYNEMLNSTEKVVQYDGT